MFFFFFFSLIGSITSESVASFLQGFCVLTRCLFLQTYAGRKCLQSKLFGKCARPRSTSLIRVAKLSYQIPTCIYGKDEWTFPWPTLDHHRGTKFRSGPAPCSHSPQEGLIPLCEWVAHSESPKGTSALFPVPNAYIIVTFTPKPWDEESSGFVNSCQPTLRS